MDPKLPPSLELRDVPNQGKGIYARELISRGQTVFRCPPYSFGVGGATVENVRGSCHHCLAIVNLKASIVCGKCKVAGYCSTQCRKSAQQLHDMECEGLTKLELLRGKTSPVTVEPDGRSYWPPPLVLMIARAINRRILQGADHCNDKWLKQLSRHNLPSTMTKEGMALIQKLVRGLVPDHVRDDEIDQMSRAVCVNAADVFCPPRTSASAFYFEFSLINHLCYPNCYFQNDSTDVFVYALHDIKCDSQLGISYLNPRFRVGERRARREELKKSFGFDCHCYICSEEVKAGSDYWLLDQQKRSLIAPWSRDWVDKVMEKGWKSIHESECMEKDKAIKLLEAELEVQKLFLDKVNIILILTTWQLVRIYCLLPDHRRSIIHLKSLGMTGMNAFFTYSTAKEVVDIGNTLSTCFSEVGLEKEASELLNLLLCFYPSNDMIHMAKVPASMEEDIKKMYLQKDTHQVKQLVSYILKLCDHIHSQ